MDDAEHPEHTIAERAHAPKGRVGPKKVWPKTGQTKGGKPYVYSAKGPLPDDKRCTATSHGSGERCRRPRIPGGTVCRYHGGSVTVIKAKAEERLRALQYPAIERLRKLIAQEEFPTVALGAAKDVLDRTMGKPGEALELNVNVNLDAEILVRLEAWRQRNARDEVA